MSELQKEILNMIIIFDNNTLLSVKPILEKLLDEEILRIDSNAKINEMDINDKIDTLKAVKELNTDTTISYEEALKLLNIGSDEVWSI